MSQSKDKLRIAVLASTSGSDLPAIFSMHPYQYKFVFLLTNKENCGARQKAKQFHVPDIFLSSKGKTRAEYDEEILSILEEKNIDLVVLVGWMRILSPRLVHRYYGRMMNVHPSLLPAFAGGMDTNVHEEVLTAGVPETGATIHFVTQEADEGPIILQESCPVSLKDTPKTLKQKVQKIEQKIYPKAIELFRMGKLQITGNKVKIHEQ